MNFESEGVGALRHTLVYRDLPSPEHAGLWLNRYMKSVEYASGEKPDRSDLFRQAGGIRPSSIYLKALKRLSEEPEPTAFRCYADVTVESIGRLAVGLGTFNSLETGLTLHHTYGMPILPGSSLKGVLRHYLRERFGDDFAYNSEASSLILGHSGAAAESKIDKKAGRGSEKTDEQLEGLKGRALVTINDGWYVPNLSRDPAPLCLDVMTPHHVEYYTGGKGAPPTEYDQPVPVSFLSVKPTCKFLIRIEGPDETWVEWVAEQLAEALEHRGIGAKTSSGYGRLEKVGRVNVYAPPPERGEFYAEYTALIVKFVESEGAGSVRERFDAVKGDIGDILDVLEGRDRIDAIADFKRLFGSKKFKKLKKIFAPWYQALMTELGAD